jgi:hypothetical protein
MGVWRKGMVSPGVVVGGFGGEIQCSESALTF